MKKYKILVFTGAGADKESGVETFRDSEVGYWNNYKVEDVATMDGWRRDKQKALDFYNEMRSKLENIKPSKAHLIISDLEKYFDVTIVTQNVTDLHEKAGSTKIIHLHGELNKVRSTLDSSIILDWQGDLNIGDKCNKGSQLRPDVTWFGEELNQDNIIAAMAEAYESDICIIIGTSMQVYPAASIPFETKEKSLIFYVDPGDVNFEVPVNRRSFFEHIKEPATIGMEIIYNDLIDIFI